MKVINPANLHITELSMKKKILAVLMSLCMLCMTACSDAGTISTYTISLEEMPGNFDPQVASKDNELLVLTNIFDGLFEYKNGIGNSNADFLSLRRYERRALHRHSRRQVRTFWPCGTQRT